MRTFKLSDNRVIPGIGFGTGTALYKKDASDPVSMALEAGFKHIDAARMYKNEKSVGTAIASSGKPRSELFITTKIDIDATQPHETIAEQLSDLGVQYVDLYLIHSPTSKTNGTLADLWRAFSEIKRKGLAKSIGVSNFRISDLKQILDASDDKPVVNQLEFHPYVYAKTKPLLEFCQSNGITVTAYSPLAPITNFVGGPLDPVLEKISEERQLTPGQVLIGWSIAKGVVPITTSSKKSRMEEMLKANEVNLTADEVQQIDDASANYNRRIFWKELME